MQEAASLLPEEWSDMVGGQAVERRNVVLALLYEV